MPIDPNTVIYKTENIDGKMYKVMYFKGRDGRMIRSKYPQLVKPKTNTNTKTIVKKKLKNNTVAPKRNLIITRQIQAPENSPTENIASEWEALSRR